MSTASGDEDASAPDVTESAPDVTESVSVVSSSVGEKDEDLKSHSSQYATAAEDSADASESAGPTSAGESEKIDDQPSNEEGETHDHEDGDGDLSDGGSSVAGSSGGSQAPETEREEGDGQEEGDKKDKKLDHDEDRRDPQYIPKRGVFYEHDDRTLDEDPEDKKELPREPRKSKAEHIERWGHDMYDELEQSPKSTEELLDAYGYDIRKEEAPPKARRRRRYGKGPNKYQRSWEDEQAYNKSPARGGYRGGQKRQPRNFENRDEDFPSLPGSEPVVRELDSENSTRPPPPPHRDQEQKTPPKPTPREGSELTKEEIRVIFDKLDFQLEESLAEESIAGGPSHRMIESRTFRNEKFKSQGLPSYYCYRNGYPVEPTFLNPLNIDRLLKMHQHESIKFIFDELDRRENERKAMNEEERMKYEFLYSWVLNQDPAWELTDIHGDQDYAESSKSVHDESNKRENEEKLYKSLTFWRQSKSESNPVEPQDRKPICSYVLEREDPGQPKTSRPRTDERPFRGNPNVRGRGGARRGRLGNDSVQPFTKSQAHGPNHAPDKHPKGGSTADEDIAALAQHFSNAVINVDKNIAPIRSQSEPPAEERPRHNAASTHHPQRHEGHHKHQEKHPGVHAQEKQMAPEQPSTKSKRYSTQRQRPPTGGQAPPTSAPPPTAQQIPNAPNYLPPQQGYYPPQHGICPPEGPAPHIAAPPAQFQPGVQVVTFLPTVPPPPTNTFQPPPNIYVPPAPYIPPPPIVQPPPAEVYQGGVTYYNTHSQQVTRAAPSRRVKLAIPIVAPDSPQPIQ